MERHGCSTARSAAPPFRRRGSALAAGNPGFCFPQVGTRGTPGSGLSPASAESGSVAPWLAAGPSRGRGDQNPPSDHPIARLKRNVPHRFRAARHWEPLPGTTMTRTRGCQAEPSNDPRPTRMAGAKAEPPFRTPLRRSNRRCGRGVPEAWSAAGAGTVTRNVPPLVDEPRIRHATPRTSNVSAKGPGPAKDNVLRVLWPTDPWVFRPKRTSPKSQGQRSALM